MSHPVFTSEPGVLRGRPCPVSQRGDGPREQPPTHCLGDRWEDTLSGSTVARGACQLTSPRSLKGTVCHDEGSSSRRGTKNVKISALLSLFYRQGKWGREGKTQARQLPPAGPGCQAACCPRTGPGPCVPGSRLQADIPAVPPRLAGGCEGPSASFSWICVRNGN